MVCAVTALGLRLQGFMGRETWQAPIGYNHEPDFKFVVIEKFLSVENEFTLRDGVLLNAYFFLKYLGQRDEKAFGLDKSDVVVEFIPLIYHQAETPLLKRNQNAITQSFTKKTKRDTKVNAGDGRG